MKRLFKLAALILVLAGLDAHAGGYSNYPLYGDGHWRAPVATLGALPSVSNALGDIRLVTGTLKAYVWNGSAWVVIVPATIVSGPGSSTDNAVARWDGTTGQTIQNSSVFIDDSGFLGVGTASPGVPLHVKRTSSSGVAKFESTGGNSTVAFFDSGTTNNPVIGSSGDTFVIGTGGSSTTRLSVDSTGNVNFPALTASSLLQLDSSKNVISSTYTAGSVLFSNGTTVTQDNTNLFWDSTNHIFMVEGTAGTGGQLFVNKTTSSVSNIPLHVKRITASGSSAARFESSTSNVNIGFMNTGGSNSPLVGASGDTLFFATGASSINAETIDSSGNINLPLLTASLPLQLDSSKNIVTTAINLAGSQVTGTLPIGGGGTGGTSYTTGSIPYSNGTVLTQDNSNLFWDGTNHRLGIGTTSPTVPLQVKRTSSSGVAVFESSGTDAFLSFLNSGDVGSTPAIGASSGTFIIQTGSGSASRVTIDSNGMTSLSTNGALSTPVLTLTGTAITGGSATTTKPLMLIEPSGTASTAWNTNGTMLGINGAFGSGNLIDVQSNGSTLFKVNANSTSRFNTDFGIGVDPSFPLQVQNNSAAAYTTTTNQNRIAYIGTSANGNARNALLNFYTGANHSNCWTGIVQNNGVDFGDMIWGCEDTSGNKTERMHLTNAGVLSLPGLSTGLPVQTNSSKELVSAAIDLSGAQATGTIAAARMPALTGDVTTSAGAVATTVAKIQTTTVSGTTGSTNVVFSTSPTMTTPIIGGVTDASSASAGKYGEVLLACSGDATCAAPTEVSLGGTQVFTDIVTLSVTAGDWLMSAMCYMNLNGGVLIAPSGLFPNIRIITATGNDGTGGVEQVNTIYLTAPSTTVKGTATITDYHISTSGTATYRVKGYAEYITADPKLKCSLKAVRLPH